MLRATLAERLGRVSAKEADDAELHEFWAIERPVQRARRIRFGSEVETPVERALRRSGVSACSHLLPTMPREPRIEARCAPAEVTTRRRCGWWPRYEHTLMFAPQVRACMAGTMRCTGGDDA